MRALLPFAVSILSAACIPLPMEMRPRTAGTVIDAETREALAGASVCVETWALWMPSLELARVSESAEVVTDASGNYEVKRRTEWMIPPRCCDRGPSPRWNRVIVSREGYETKVFWEMRWYGSPPPSPTAFPLTPLVRGVSKRRSCPAGFADDDPEPRQVYDPEGK
jgi:hypothetical protein